MAPTQPSAEFAYQVVRRLQEAGFEALLAGGCVRDQLMGREPKDYDVATSATPAQVRDLFGRRRTLAIGVSFGVVAVQGPRGVDPVEVATFRSEGGYSDGRHPDQVAFSTAEQDAQRRDFTINGIFYDPLRDQVIDYVGGQQDLQRRIIRCIGDPNERFDEDKLRMLRAIRFGATLNFDVTADTLAAITQHADELQVVSAERIHAEMRHILCYPTRPEPMQQLRSTGLWRIVLPEYFESDAAVRDELWGEMLNVLQQLTAPRNFAVTIAALLLPLTQSTSAAAVVARLAARWKLPNHDRDECLWMLNHVDSICRAPHLPWPQLQRVLIGPAIESLLELATAVIQARPSPDDDLSPVEFCRRKLALPPHQLNPAPLVNGNDLIRAGIPAGKTLGQLLRQIRDAQLNGEIVDAPSAIAWAKRVR